LLITRTQGGDERRHVLVTFEAAKPFDGFEDGGGGPPKDHLTTTPPFDIPLHVTRATDQAFDRVGGRERLAQTIGQAERRDRERFLQHRWISAAAPNVCVTALWSAFEPSRITNRLRSVRKPRLCRSAKRL